jgi:DNA-binding transcriptional regulator YhcF (GntR family)
VTVTEHGRGTFVSASAQRLGDEYRIQALSQAVERMLVEAHLLGASADEVRAMVDEKLQGEKESK